MPCTAQRTSGYAPTNLFEASTSLLLSPAAFALPQTTLMRILYTCNPFPRSCPGLSVHGHARATLTLTLTSKVVDRAVLAAGMDDDEWRARLERGQKLARKAEARRRDSRDAQRTAEETIAKQAAELKRLKEEAKEARARGGGGRRPWRSHEVGFGFPRIFCCAA